MGLGLYMMGIDPSMAEWGIWGQAIAWAWALPWQSGVIVELKYITEMCFQQIVSNIKNSLQF